MPCEACRVARAHAAHVCTCGACFCSSDCQGLHICSVPLQASILRMDRVHARRGGAR